MSSDSIENGTNNTGVLKWVLIGISGFVVIFFLTLLIYSNIGRIQSLLEKIPFFPKKLPAQTAVSEQAIPGSFISLLSSETPQYCTFTAEGNGGSFYISSGKARLDYENFEQSIKYHIIINGGDLYIWENDNKTGYKTTLPLITNPPSPESSPLSAGGFDANTDLSSNCGDWNAKDSVFGLPEGVTFSDYNIQLPPPKATPAEATTSSETAIPAE